MHGHERLHHSAGLTIDQQALRGPSALATQKFPDRLWVQIESYRIDVHKSRESAFIQKTIYGCHEAERCCNNFIIRANSQRPHAQMQGGSAAVHCDGMA